MPKWEGLVPISSDGCAAPACASTRVTLAPDIPRKLCESQETKAITMPDTIGAMWPHFIGLLARSWQSFRTSLSTTSLGFIAPLVVAGVSILISLLVLGQHEGEVTLKRRRREMTVALFVIVVVALLVFVPIFLYQGLVKTMYNEHQELVTRVKELQNKGQEKDKQMQELKVKLNGICRNPDRHLTQSDCDLLLGLLNNVK